MSIDLQNMPWPLAILVSFTLACIAMATLNHIALRAWRKAVEAHWTERARLSYPARVSAGLNLGLLAACAVVLGWTLGHRDSPLLLLFALAGVLGAVLGCFPFERQLFPEIRLKEWISQIAQSWGSRLLLFGPLIAVGALMPREWGWKVAAIGVCFAAWYLWFGSIGYFQVLIWLRILKPAAPEALQRLEECFVTTGIRPRAVWTMETPLALAFAIPTRNELLFSRAFLEKLTLEEIKAITYHELAHLSEDRFTVARRMLGMMIFYPFIFVRPLVESWGLPGFLPIYAVFGLILILNIRIGKKMERRADAEAFARDPGEGAYARALEKLYRINQIPAVMPSRGQIHPHLYDRMLAAGITPDFPRPKAPNAIHWTFVIPVFIGVLLYLSNF